jgi:MFS family permease
LGAALLVPGSLALISATFPEDERGRAFGTWAGVSGITSAIGPLLGGWLIDRFSWAWAFALNLPVALLVLALAWLHVPESRRPGPVERMDFAGAALATLGLGGLVFFFIEAPSRGWRAPLVLVALALGGGLFFLPLNLIQVQGLSATAAGAALLPFIAIMFVLSRWAGGLVDRRGARLPLIVGPLIAAAGFALLMLPGSRASYWTGFLPGIAVLGLGMTVTIAPLTTTVMNSVERASAGTASGVNNAVSRAAGLLAVAVFGALMAALFEPRLRQALAAAGLPEDVVRAVWEQRDKLGAIRAPAELGAEVARAVHAAGAVAFVAGYGWIMGASAVLAVVGAGVAVVGISDRGGEG